MCSSDLPVEVAPVAAAPVVVAPVPARPVDPQQLKGDLSLAGLEWVQTAPDHAAPIEAPAEPPPQMGRKPRKTVVASDSESLTMVETRSPEQPPTG